MGEEGTVEMPVSARTAKLPEVPRLTAEGPRAKVLPKMACNHGGLHIVFRRDRESVRTDKVKREMRNDIGV